MKKVLSAILCLCMILATLNFTVFATEEISTFGISMCGFKAGVKESDITFAISDDRLNIEVKTSETGEYLSKAEEALKHKHCYCGGYVEIGGHTSHETFTYQKWPSEKAIKYTNGKAYIYLDKDVALDNTMNIGGDKTLYLCLNGHSLAIHITLSR